MYNLGSSPTVTNCIIWGDSAPTGQEIYDAGSSSTALTYSHVQGRWPHAGDPLFVDPGHWDDNGTPGDTSDDLWVNGDLRLQVGSPCIDAADGDAAPSTDMDGNARHDDPGSYDLGAGSPTFTDMGAHEFQGTSTGITPGAPADGVAWNVGVPLVHVITWRTGPPVVNVWIELSRDDGSSWEDIVASTDATTGAYFWTGTGPASTDCLVRISDADNVLTNATTGLFWIVEPLTLTLSQGDATEGDGTLSIGTVSVPTPVTSDLTVTLSSSDETEATVPAQVTIPTGLTSAGFDISIVDDTQDDGDQTVTISASAVACLPGNDSILVLDDDGPPTLTVTLSQSEATEGDGALSIGTVSIPDPVASDLTVTLASSDETEATVPVWVIIPVGLAHVDFDVTIVDDSGFDGAQTVVISATATGCLPGNSSLWVRDAWAPPPPEGASFWDRLLEVLLVAAIAEVETTSSTIGTIFLIGG